MIGQRTFAEVGGYELEVNPQWDQLTDSQRDQIGNGIGPECWPEEARAILDAATGFRQVGIVHDVDYAVGRTSEDRKEGDKRLLRNCRRVVVKDAGGWLAVIFRGRWKEYLARMGLARIMYRALRLFGGYYFNRGTVVHNMVMSNGIK